MNGISDDEPNSWPLFFLRNVSLENRRKGRSEERCKGLPVQEEGAAPCNRVMMTKGLCFCDKQRDYQGRLMDTQSLGGLSPNC